MSLSPQQRQQLNMTETVVYACVYLSTPELVFEAPLTGVEKRADGIIGVTYGTPTQGSIGAVGSDMTLDVDIDGQADGGRVRVRGESHTGDTLYIGRCSSGRGDGQITPDTNGTIRVYREYRPFTKIPHIDENDVQYKDETTYPGDAAAQPPVANAGRDRLLITDADTASVTLDAQGDIPSFTVADGATISSYAWDVQDGTITTGTGSAAQIDVSFPQGERYVSLTVTDSSGVSHTAHVLIVVASKADCVPCRIGQYRLRPDTKTMELTVSSADLPDSIRRGARVIVAEAENYSFDTLVGYSERFIGWLGNETSTLADAANQQKDVSLSLIDSSHVLKESYLFSLSINYIVEQGGWFQMANANIDRFIHHILHWHSNILALCDYAAPGVGSTYPLPELTANGSSFWEAVSRVAGAVAHELTIGMLGEIRIEPNPDMQPTAAQAIEFGLPTQRKSGVITTLTASDYSNHAIQGYVRPRCYWYRTLAIVASASSTSSVVGSVAPGSAPGQGAGKQNNENLLVTSQAELNVWTANFYEARLSNRVGDLTLDLLNPRHYIDPARRAYLGIELSAYDRQRYNIPADARWIVDEIIYTYGDYGQKRAQITQAHLERTAYEPAQTDVTGTEADAVQQSWNSFESGIDTTTGNLILGNPDMVDESILNRLVAVTQFRVQDVENIIEELGDGSASGASGGAVDEDGIAVPTTEEEAFGHLFAVAAGFVDFVEETHDQYTVFAGEDSTTAAANLRDYLMAVYETTGQSDVQAYADDVHANGGFNPALGVTEIEQLGFKFYCVGGTYRTGINRFAFDRDGNGNAIYTAAIRDLFILASKCIADAQYTAWYNRGNNKPSTRFKASPCYLWPPQRFNITVSNNLLEGEVTDWSARVDPTLVRVTAVGEITHPDGHILRGNWSYNATAKTWGWHPVGIYKVRPGKDLGNVLHQTALSFSAYPRSDTTEVFTGIFGYLAQSDDTSAGEIGIIDPRDFPDGSPRSEGTGGITYTIEDLGEI